MRGIRTLAVIFTLSCLAGLAGCTVSDHPASGALEADYPAPEGPYLGQEPPGSEPRLFAPGIVSTGMNELSLCFSPDGRELYLHVTGPMFRPRFMLTSRMEGSKWTRLREVSFFSPGREDSYPFVAPDGKRLYFCSVRPDPETPGHHHRELWYVERMSDGWGPPRRIDFGEEYRSVGTYPAVAANGNLYFNGSMEPGNSDIFLSVHQDGKYMPPVNLGSAVNSGAGDWHPYIAPDESYLLFDSNREDGGYGANDLYVCFRRQDGTWTQARNLGDSVNTPFGDMRPFVTADGRYLFFTSSRLQIPELGQGPMAYDEVRDVMQRPGNGLQDIYWVRSEVFLDLKPE